MNSVPQLPDLNQLPSVLETREVDAVLRQIADALDHNAEIRPIAAVERMIDAFFARGYRPGEHFDQVVCARILQWLRRQWPTGDPEFAGHATTVLANLTCAGVDDYLQELLRTEARAEIRADLKQVIEERRSST